MLITSLYAASRNKEPFLDGEQHHPNYRRNDEHPIGRLFGDVTGLILVLVMLAIAMIPVYIAVKCNPEHPILYGILAFLFSEIYLVQFLVRKFVMQSPGYCSAL